MIAAKAAAWGACRGLGAQVGDPDGWGRNPGLSRLSGLAEKSEPLAIKFQAELCAIVDI